MGIEKGLTQEMTTRPLPVSQTSHSVPSRVGGETGLAPDGINVSECNNTVDTASCEHHQQLIRECPYILSCNEYLHVIHSGCCRSK